MKRHIALTVFCVLCAVIATASAGTIKGVVIDEAGNPVYLANVLARDTEPKASGGVLEAEVGIVPWVETDNHGQFTVRGLIPGHHYKVFAKKEEDGYANPTIPTYNPKLDAQIVVASDSPRSSPDVRIQLGPKAVILHWQLKDAVTGKPLKEYHITVTRVDTDYTFGGVEGGNTVLLPADTDMSIRFDVKGYEPWYYPGQNTKEAATPMRGAAGEQKELEVLLKPQKAAQ